MWRRAPEPDLGYISCLESGPSPIRAYCIHDLVIR